MWNVIIKVISTFKAIKVTGWLVGNIICPERLYNP
jgi:hypothetical protein